MPRRSNWYPSQIYDLLYRLGHANNLSYQEVAFMLLREALLPYGFDCNHPTNKIGNSPTDNTPYCKNCMSRLERVEEQVLNSRRFWTTQIVLRARETFLDRIRKENKQKIDDDFEARVKTEVDTRIKALTEDALSKERQKGSPTC